MSAIRQERDRRGHFKDEILSKLSADANVAQFVSFAPGSPSPRFVCLRREPEGTFASVGAALSSLLECSHAGSVNVRSFDPSQPRGHEFIYGLRDLQAIESAVTALASKGLYTIVNETIDVADGGVSGVAFGGIVEFAPGDTPRCVDKPGTASLPRAVALPLLRTVYGFDPALQFPDDTRVEFSVHPRPHGVRNEHTIIWELESQPGAGSLHAEWNWPNRMSRFLGDKAFGLLVADALGFPVPRTILVSRGVPPFSFGRETGTTHYWLRTCPTEQQPGRFTTTDHWVDPFALLATEDPSGNEIASVISQEGVRAEYSGAAVGDPTGAPTVEGVKGTGDAFMRGDRAPNALPAAILESVEALYSRAAAVLGPIRFEWVHDGEQPWIVQFHRGATLSTGLTIYPGQPRKERRFEVSDGLEALRSLVNSLGPEDGVVLAGEVGITSHFGDILRRARVPSRLELPPSTMALRLFDADA